MSRYTYEVEFDGPLRWYTVATGIDEAEVTRHIMRITGERGEVVVRRDHDNDPGALILHDENVGERWRFVPVA